MMTEFGHFALIVALIVACIQTIVPLVGLYLRRPELVAIASPAATAQFFLLSGSFAALTYAFITSDFTLQLVVSNSHSLKPMLYKISGVWGNHEGSMLLWVVILAFYGACIGWFGQNLTSSLLARVIAVQGAIGVAFISFLVFTSNPFLRMPLPPFDGQDLNPLLQDPGLAFHPPILYLGYVGLSVSFSFAIAALLEGRVDAAWARWVRPWTLAAWMFLTLGIALGSWWAYYELGWGGFWFWDPVENASFMPWLLAAALLHSSIVVEKRESLKSWTILLAILAFGFALIGTFIVRSGILTSVHAFANDPERGLYILLILIVFIGGALILYALRAAVMEAQGVFAVVSRETALIANNILLAVSAFVIFVGTIWPLIAELLFDRKLTVGAPYFNLVFTPLMMALAVILPIGAMISWKRGHLLRPIRKMRYAFLISLVLASAIWAMQTGKSLQGPIGLFLGSWLVFGALTELVARTGQNVNLSRLIRLPKSDWAKFLAHSGFGIMIFAIAGLSAWQAEDIRSASIGETWTVGGYELTLKDVRRQSGPNYQSTVGAVAVSKDGQFISLLNPEKRFYPVAQMPTTEAAIHHRVFSDIYVVLADPQADDTWVVRTYIKPLSNWIWGGSILMALGGLLSLFDRRLRLAPGQRRNRPSHQASGSL